MEVLKKEDVHVWSSKDFMLGDYVYLDNKIIKINNLTPCKIGYVDEAGRQRYVRNCEKRIQPVEATHEILQKIDEDTRPWMTAYKYVHLYQHADNSLAITHHVKRTKFKLSE